MERADAQELAARLGQEHPERARYRWLAREQADGGWTVVKVALPSSRQPVNTAVEARPRPPYDDSKQPWESAGGLPWYLG
jgi:hypothetical protein